MRYVLEFAGARVWGTAREGAGNNLQHCLTVRSVDALKPYISRGLIAKSRLKISYIQVYGSQLMARLCLGLEQNENEKAATITDCGFLDKKEG